MNHGEPQHQSGGDRLAVVFSYFANLWAVDRFFGVIVKVVYTKTSPKMALAMLQDAAKPKAAKQPKPIDKQRRFELN